MKTFKSENKAEEYMSMYNRSLTRLSKRSKNILCVVDGPDDGEYTVMPIDEAIDNGFMYSWSMI